MKQFWIVYVIKNSDIAKTTELNLFVISYLKSAYHLIYTFNNYFRQIHKVDEIKKVIHFCIRKSNIIAILYKLYSYDYI